MNNDKIIFANFDCNYNVGEEQNLIKEEDKNVIFIKISIFSLIYNVYRCNYTFYKKF